MHNQAAPEGTKRYYDAERELSSAVQIIHLLPSYAQEIVAEGLSLMAFKDHRLESKLRTIGVESILAINKSQFKRRKIDRNRHLHNALNHLRLLSSRERKVISDRIIELASYMNVYLTECAVNTDREKQKDTREIRDGYIEWGPEKAKAYIEVIREEIINQRINHKESTRIDYDTGTIQH